MSEPSASTEFATLLGQIADDYAERQRRGEAVDPGEYAARYPHLPLYLQPGNHTPPPPDDDSAVVDIEGVNARMRWLVEKVVDDRWFAARVLPQLHVLLWGNKRGV